MRKSLPKEFTKLASSPTREGILKHITRYYTGGEWDISPQTENLFSVVRSDGKVVSTNVIQTTRGFYFGYFP